MSRIANAPVAIPKGVETTLSDTAISVKGSKGNLNLDLHELVGVSQEGEELKVAAKNQTRQAGALAGTFRSLINNMVVGVSEGFQKKLELQGVGYRAQMKGSSLNLQLGFSHDVNFPVPEGIKIETPDQTTIIVSGINKQLVGETAAKIREYRKPEPYKGKGIRYDGEYVFRKEGKKK